MLEVAKLTEKDTIKCQVGKFNFFELRLSNFHFLCFAVFKSSILSEFGLHYLPV